MRRITSTNVSDTEVRVAEILCFGKQTKEEYKYVFLSLFLSHSEKAALTFARFVLLSLNLLTFSISLSVSFYMDVCVHALRLVSMLQTLSFSLGQTLNGMKGKYQLINWNSSLFWVNFIIMLNNVLV